MNEEVKLPPLPALPYTDLQLCEPFEEDAGGFGQGYTEDHMHAYATEYARTAVLAERERCAKVCEALIDPQDEDDGRDFWLRTVAAAIRGNG